MVTPVGAHSHFAFLLRLLAKSKPKRLIGRLNQGWILYNCRAGMGQGAGEWAKDYGTGRVGPAEGGEDGDLGNLRQHKPLVTE